MSYNIIGFRLLNKDTVSKMVREEELLVEIAMISSLRESNKYKKEFQCSNNLYNFESYLNKLERVRQLLMKGFNDTDLIIKLIRTNSDYLIG